MTLGEVARDLSDMSAHVRNMKFSENRCINRLRVHGLF